MTAETVKPRFYTLAEAAAYSRIGRSTLYVLLKKGKITGKKTGKKLLIEVAALDRYLDSLPGFTPGTFPQHAGKLRNVLPDLTDDGPYATEEDGEVADELGISVNQLRRGRVDQDD